MNEKFELRAERNYLAINQIMLLTSGSVNVYPVKITFSADWNGLDRRVVFRAGGGDVFAVELDEAGICNIPWEALTEPNKPLFVGVYGTKGGDTVLPTIWADLGQIYPGTAPGEGSGPPTPDAWQQLKDDLKQASEELADIKKYSDAAGESAKQAGGAVETVGRLAQGASGAAAEASRQATAAGTSAGAAEQSRKDADAARAAAETARAEAKEHRDAAKRSEDEALKSANKAVEYSGKPPIIQGGTWWSWAAEKQAYVDTGEPANVNPRGEYDPEAVYNRMDVVRRAGSSYLALREGLTGVLPIDGEDWMCLVERSGKSAYEQAVDAGLTATEAEFKSALAKVVDAWGRWKEGLTDEESADPDIVYSKTRPRDWVEMPTLDAVQDGELWMLVHLPVGTVNTYTLEMTHNATNLLIFEVGEFENGVFVPKEKYTRSLTSNSAFQFTLDSSDFGNVTSENKTQAVVRVSGKILSLNIGSTFADVVDAVVRDRVLESITITKTFINYLGFVGEFPNATTANLSENRLLKCIYGSASLFNNITSIYALFDGNISFLALPVDVTFERARRSGYSFRTCASIRQLPLGITFENLEGHFISMFDGCSNLRYFPEAMNFKCEVTELQGMVSGCKVTNNLPKINLNSAASLSSSFSTLYNIKSIDWIYAPVCTDLSYAFSSSLFASITNLYIPKCKNMTNAFQYCYVLEELTFSEEMTEWETPCDIVLTNTRMTHPGIIKLFNSLPVIQTPKTITLTNTPGASQVTAEDVAIATAKGWLVAGVPAGIATGSPGSVEGPEIFASKEDVQAVWDQMAAAYAEGVNEA